MESALDCPCGTTGLRLSATAYVDTNLTMKIAYITNRIGLADRAASVAVVV